MAHSTTYERQRSRFDVGILRAWLNRYSIDVLRISLGLVFALFGILKFIPGASPAEDLAVRTVDTLTFGLVSGTAALWTTAFVESVIGLTLVTGRFIRTGLVVLGLALIGIMSPVVLFFGELFPGAPTLEAQYVLKDLVLAAAGLVIGAAALGSRLTDH
jgi:putative oxidoreductase